MIDINKKYKTKSGYEVVIHTVNGKNSDYPVIGERKGNHVWEIEQWTKEGLYHFDDDDLTHKFDLVEVIEKEVTVYFWEDTDGQIVSTSHFPLHPLAKIIEKKTFKLIDGKII